MTNDVSSAKISYRVIVSAFIIAVLAISSCFLLFNQPKAPKTTGSISQQALLTSSTPPTKSIVPTSSVSSVVEYPPLYSNLQWKYTNKKMQSASYTRNGDTIGLDMYRADSETLTVYPDEFIAYYQRYLSRNGWVLTGTTASGETVDFRSYEKDNHYVNFGVFKSHDNLGKISKFWAFVEHD